MSEFVVGQKVVRIKGCFYEIGSTCKKDIGDITQIGEIYEVRWVGPCDFFRAKGEIGLKFVGLKRCTQSQTRPSDINIDIPFGSRSFRPLQENKIAEVASKAVEFFRKLATDATQKEKVTVPNE